MPIHALERQVDTMRGRIDRDRMRVRCTILAQRTQDAPVSLKGADDAAFGCYVEAPPLRVPSENIGAVTNRMSRDHLHGSQIEDEEFRVLFIGDEGEAAGLVDRESVRMV